MRRRSIGRVAGAMLLAGSMLSALGQAPPASAGHCQPVFLLAGSTVGTVAGYRPVAVNLGQAGCVVPTQPEIANTNHIPVGVTQVWGGVSQFDGTPTGGSIYDGTTTTTLSWTFYLARLRWESATVTIPATASSVTVTTTIGSTSYSVTYVRP